MNWEYTHVTVGATANGREQLVLGVNALGSLGWEVVGITSIDQTVGGNATMAILKRQAPELPAPVDHDAGWRPDPSGRHELRHWDGTRWTQHVSDAGSTDTDWPNVRAD